MLSAPSNYNKTGEFIRVLFPPPGHVHSGNVIIDEGSCKWVCVVWLVSDGCGSLRCFASRLVDIENTLVGLPSMYRTHLLELRKIHVSSFALRLVMHSPPSLQLILHTHTHTRAHTHTHMHTHAHTHTHTHTHAHTHAHTHPPHTGLRTYSQAFSCQVE